MIVRPDPYVVGASYSFRYHSELRQRELLAARLEASLAEARLQALHARLNPHFFFNTLNAIAVLALKRDHEAVIDMLARLGDLIRISLDEKRPQVIPLAQEIEFLDAYLDIQRLLFGKRLTIHLGIAPETLNALVPRMILQPVVENAIMHGISPQRGTARIAIDATRDRSGILRLCVSDNGSGFGPNTTRGAGIGLANTHARLQQLYGPASRIEYAQSTEDGTSVTITIPFAPASIHGVSGEGGDVHESGGTARSVIAPG